MANSFPLMSSEIYSSREIIRNQLCDYCKTYLDLSNVDLTKSSFLSYIIDTISSLASNLIFYSSSTYREFFLVSAQLPSSVYNLAAFLGYNPVAASSASTSVLVTIPLTFSDPYIQINLLSGTNFYAGSTPFQTYYNTLIEISNNNSVIITISSGTQTYNIPASFDSTSSFSFLLPVVQTSTLTQTFQIDADVAQYSFVTLDVPFTGQASSISVSIQEPNSVDSTTYQQFSSLYLMNNTDRGYVSQTTDSGVTLYFGNNLIGYQPPGGSTVIVTTIVTLGSSGNIISGSINTGDRIYTTDSTGSTQILNYSVINVNPAVGGSDQENIDQIRSNAINSLTERNRLVSENDYINTNVIIPNSPILGTSLPILKRSDLKINEIVLFLILQYLGEPVPTKNIYYSFPLGSTFIPKNTILYINNESFSTMFDMNIDIGISEQEESTYTDNYYIYNSNIDTNIIPINFYYTPGANTIEVYLNGRLLNKQTVVNNLVYGDYIEYSNSSIELLIQPNNGDILRFRLVTPTQDDFLYILNSNDIQNLSFFLPAFSGLAQDLKIFKNGYYLNEEVNGVGDYIWNKSTNEIIFNISLNINFGDIIRIIAIDLPEIKVLYTVQPNDLSSNLIPIEENYMINSNVIEVYNNGLLLNAVLPITNSNGTTQIYGSYYEISPTYIQFVSGILQPYQLISYRVVQELPQLSYLSNDVATYSYVIDTLSLNPILSVVNNNIPTDIVLNQININRFDSTSNLMSINVLYTSPTYNDSTSLLCNLTITQSDQSFTSVSNNNSFNYLIDFTTIPTDNITLNFSIFDSTGNELVVYYVNTIISQNLDMQSNLITNPTDVTIYDIPTISTNYLNNLTNSADFELQIYQSLLTSFNLYNYRMLTDFINIKFADCIGNAENMTYDTTSRTEVINIISSLPTTAPNIGDRYIVSYTFDSTASQYINQIIQWNGVDWSTETPVLDDIIYVQNLNSIVIFTGDRFIIPIYNIPIQISLEVIMQSNYTGSTSGLVSNIQNALLTTFSSNFGVNGELYRSQIIDVVQNVSGVDHCTLLQPESDIFFNFNVDNFTEEQILEFSPNYIYFTSDSITIKIVNG